MISNKIGLKSWLCYIILLSQFPHPRFKSDFLIKQNTLCEKVHSAIQMLILYLRELHLIL